MRSSMSTYLVFFFFCWGCSGKRNAWLYCQRVNTRSGNSGASMSLTSPLHWGQGRSPMSIANSIEVSSSHPFQGKFILNLVSSIHAQFICVAIALCAIRGVQSSISKSIWMWTWTWIWSLKNANPSKSSRNRGVSTLKSDLNLHDFACRMSCRVGVQMHCVRT
jgi:hypothetical protein